MCRHHPAAGRSGLRRAALPLSRAGPVAGHEAYDLRYRAHESLIAEVMPLAASCTLAIPAAAGWISRGAGQRRRVLAGWLPLPKLAAHLLCPLVCIVSERAVCTVSACCPETILHILQVCQSCL